MFRIEGWKRKKTVSKLISDRDGELSRNLASPILPFGLICPTSCCLCILAISYRRLFQAERSLKTEIEARGRGSTRGKRQDEFALKSRLTPKLKIPQSHPTKCFFFLFDSRSSSQSFHALFYASTFHLNIPCHAQPSLRRLKFQRFSTDSKCRKRSRQTVTIPGCSCLRLDDEFKNSPSR